MTNRSEFDARPFERALVQWFDDLSDRGIFSTDEALVIRTWNPWLEAQTGISSSQAIGASVCTLYPSLADRGLVKYYEDALKGEVRVLAERLHKYLLPISRSFQSIGLTEMAQTARIGPLTIDGRVIGTITLIEDVTERVVSERELRNQIAAAENARGVAEEASRLKDEFLATLSHEIRTPLNAVLGWARILRTQPTIKSRDRALEVIERNASSQMRLVEDLLDMARVISGKLRLDVKPVMLETIARAAVDVLAPAAQAKNITIRTDFKADLPPVNGDPDRLQQVIWNLMSNAVKFTEPGGHIDVKIAAIDDWLELSVRDNGLGIHRDFLPYVFDRFRQADATPSRRHGGLGLGLALVRQIVELHGGQVAVDSAGAGRGAVFSVRLPAMSDATSAPRELRPAAVVTLSGVTVLVVDDDQDGRDMLAVMLTDYGASVRAVGSSEEAWEILDSREWQPDILVSDVGMPGSDGYQLIRRVRSAELPRTRTLPAITVTGYATPEDRLRALTAGFQAHIPKPFDPAIVAAWIASLVNAKSGSPAAP